MKLVGHSGCELELISKNGVKFVRKISKNKEYNERLINQALKQEKFESSFYSKPNVLVKSYTSNGLFYFDMDFLAGSTFSDYIGQVPLTNLKDYTKQFLNLIPNEQTYNPMLEVKIIEKVKSLRHNIPYNSTSVKSAFKTLARFKWIYLTESECHGDLTLENIIVLDGRMYLIDFLDSFINSWLIDFAKLFQDLETYWSYRNNHIINENTRVRIEILRVLIVRDIYKMSHGKEYIETIYHLLIINLLRIYPYTSDEKTLKWLDNKLNVVIKKIKNRNWEVDL